MEELLKQVLAEIKEIKSGMDVMKSDIQEMKSDIIDLSKITDKVKEIKKVTMTNCYDIALLK